MENPSTTEPTPESTNPSLPGEDDTTTTHRDLLETCANLAFLHNRANCYIPLGTNQLNGLQSLSRGRMLTLHLMTLCTMGAQPLVLRQLPPLARLLLTGCGNKKNEKHSAKDHPLLAKGWVLSYDLMMFYMAVLQTNAVFSKNNMVDVAAKSKALETVTRHMAATQFQILCTNGVLGAALDMEKLSEAKRSIIDPDEYAKDPKLAEMWDDLDKALRTSETPSVADKVALPLLVLGGAMCTRASANYTIELIHKMEVAIWSNIVATKAPAEEHLSLLNDVAFWTLRDSVCRVGEFPEADKEVREYGVLRQSQALRQAACNNRDACKFSQWPAVTIPSHDIMLLVGTASNNNNSDTCAPLDSGCYAVLSFYYAGLCLASSRIGVAEPEIDGAAGKA